MWGAEHMPGIGSSGDATIRKPQAGWSFAFYEAVIQQYRMARGHYPRTAKMHPSTAVAIASRSRPRQWPTPEVRTAYPLDSITLTDDAPQRHGE
jgi:hypothetical protein